MYSNKQHTQHSPTKWSHDPTGCTQKCTQNYYEFQDVRKSVHRTYYEFCSYDNLQESVFFSFQFIKSHVPQRKLGDDPLLAITNLVGMPRAPRPSHL